MTYQDYFTAHSLDPEYLRKNLGWEFDDSTITIPVYDENGKLLFCRYRQLKGEQKFTTDKGAYATLYCVHKIKKSPVVVLCEGEPDCARLWQEGIPATTSTSGVKSFTEEVAEPLRGKTVYLCLDSDKAGQESIPSYISTLEAVSADVRIVPLPKEYKDISVYFSSGKTKDDFQKLLASSIPADQWLEENEPEDFRLETGKDLLQEQLPEEQWIIERILPAEGFTFLVGAEATGKSFYTLTMSHSAVTGEPWLDTFPVKKQVNVLFIDKENTRRITQKRMKGLGYEEGQENVFRIRYPEKFEVIDRNGNISPFAQSLSRKVKKLDIGLIIVDSFADVMIGNENASADVQAFFDGMRQIFPDKAILVIHHENKPSQGVQRNSSQRVRGSSNINAQIVSGFRVEAVPKTKNEYTLEQIKIRDAEKLGKFKLSMVVKTDPNNTDSTIVTNLQYDGEVIEEKEKTEIAIQIMKEQLALQTEITRKELFEMCEGEGISASTIKRAIKEMKDSGIVKTEKRKKETYFSLSITVKTDEEIDEENSEQEELFNEN